MEPRDVSAAPANAVLAERNDCLARARRKISFPEHLLISEAFITAAKQNADFGVRKRDAAPSRCSCVGTAAESLRPPQRQLLSDGNKRRAGWAAGPGSWCLLPASADAGRGAAKYRLFSCYNTQGLARSASAEARRKCVT